MLLRFGIGEILSILTFLARYFVADNVLDEVTFGWPRQKGGLQLREHLALNLQRAINWVYLLSYVEQCFLCVHVCFLQHFTFIICEAISY